MADSIGWPHLVDDVANFSTKAPQLTALIPDIIDVDPDDAFSSVPYEKGFSLLVLIEQIVSRHSPPSRHVYLHHFSPHPSHPAPQVGTPKFEAFAKHYFSKFKKATVTSEDFRATLLAYFENDPRLTSLSWDELFYTPGLPPKPKYDTSLAEEAERLADLWASAPVVPQGTPLSRELSSSAALFDAWPTVQKQVSRG